MAYPRFEECHGTPRVTADLRENYPANLDQDYRTQPFRCYRRYRYQNLYSLKRSRQNITSLHWWISILITSTIDIDVLRFLRKMIYSAGCSDWYRCWYLLRESNVCSMSIGVRSERSRISDAHDSAWYNRAVIDYAFRSRFPIQLI